MTDEPMPGWARKALEIATDESRSEWQRQFTDNKRKPLKRFFPPEITTALCAAVGAGDEIEAKRLMTVARAGAYSLI